MGSFAGPAPPASSTASSGGSGILLAGFLQSGAAAAGAVSQSSALRTQGKYESSQAATNATMAEMQAEDARNRGEVAAQDKAKQAGQLLGSQRAGLAAQGVALDSGSAANIQKDTEAMSELDQLTIRNNAAREAFGFKIQSSNYATQGKMTEIASKNAANNTILTGGMNALSYGAKGYGDYKRATGSAPISSSGGG